MWATAVVRGACWAWAHSVAQTREKSDPGCMTVVITGTDTRRGQQNLPQLLLRLGSVTVGRKESCGRRREREEKTAA